MPLRQTVPTLLLIEISPAVPLISHGKWRNGAPEVLILCPFPIVFILQEFGQGKAKDKPKSGKQNPKKLYCQELKKVF